MWTQDKIDEFDRMYDVYTDAGEECEEAAIHALSDLRENEDE